MEIDIPDNIKSILEEVVDSFVMWDLLIFLSKHSAAMETPLQAAKLLGRTGEEMQKPFSKLVDLGIFAVRKLEDESLAYYINQQSPFLEKLHDFLFFNEVQENRLRILSYLLQKNVK